MANLSNINNKFIVTDGGHVSIGATTTTYPLTVESGGVGTVLRAGTSFVSIDSVGSATSPSLIFNGDSNTGMWRPASDTLGFSTAGVERMRIDSVGRVGIGTDSPSNKLHVQQSGLFTGIHNTAGIRIKSDGESANGNYHGTIALSKGTGSVAISAVQEANDLDVLGMAFFTHPSTTGTAASVERMRIDSDGNVGIGTTNPTNGKLVIDSTANQIAIETGTAGDGRLNIGHFSNGTFIGTYGDDGGAADLIRFGTHSGDERMRITSAGNVGIGTNSPNSKLHVESTSATGANFILESTHSGGIPLLDLKGAASAQVRYKDELNVIQGRIDFGDSGTFNFIDVPNNSSTLYLKTGGKVGIGTTSPTEHLTISGGAANTNPGTVEAPYIGEELAFKIENSAWTSTNGLIRMIQPTGAYVNNATMTFSTLQGSLTEKMRITNAGDVGIGTVSPAGKLEVNGGVGVATSGGTLIVRQDGDTGSDGIALTSSFATSHRIWKNAAGDLNIGNSGNLSALVQLMNGNLGIGTTSPAGIFHVDGDGASIYSIFSKSATKWLYLHTGGTNPAISWDSAGDMRFGTSTSNVGGGFSEKMRILSSGGITFNGDTAAANALDDYEEGTFQTNVNSTNVTNYSYSGDNGRYTKIGRQVIVTFVISSITAGTGLKYFVISNLPFTQHTSSHNEQGYCSNYPRGERRSGIIINNSSSEPNTWYVSYNNNSAQSNNSLRGTIIYTTTQ